MSPVRLFHFGRPFRIDLFFRLRYFWRVQRERNANQFGTGNFTARSRTLLASDAGARFERGRNVRARGALDAYLLPAVVPGAAAVATERGFLPHEGRGREAGLPGVPALPTKRSSRSRCTGAT